MASYRLTFIQQLWEKFINTCIPTESAKVDLPDDVVLEILSRLPFNQLVKCRSVCKKWRALTSTTYFAEKRSSLPVIPIICMQKVSMDRWDHYRDIELFFLCDNKKAKIMKKAIAISKEFNADYVAPRISGSCNGFLLFSRQFNTAPLKFYVFNPLTEELLMFTKTTDRSGVAFAIFFHSMTREYRVLACYGSTTESSCFHYEQYSLQAGELRSSRSLGAFPYLPRYYCFNSVTINQSLYWMCDKGPASLHHVPCCAEFVMKFDTSIEEIQVLPHPRNIECKGVHSCMYLIAMEEEKLCLCHMHSQQMDIWVHLENGDWMKLYSINHESWRDLVSCPLPFVIRPVKIHGEKLIVFRAFRGLFECHLQLHTVIKINVPLLDEANSHRFAFTTYAMSFVSLRDLIGC